MQCIELVLTVDPHMYQCTTHDAARSWAVGLRMATGMGALLGVVKFRNGTYLPTLVPQEESFEVRRNKRIDSS